MMPRIFEADATDHVCPFNDFKPCFGAICMAWVWFGPKHDRCETDNLQETPEGTRPVGVPPHPDGEGWEMDGGPMPKSYHRSKKEGLPPGLSQRWIRPRNVANGSCGRTAPDNDYGW